MATSSKVEHIIQEVQGLSDDERGELFQLLDEDFGEPGASWKNEIQRRIREVDNGEVELIDEEVFLAKLREP